MEEEKKPVEEQEEAVDEQPEDEVANSQKQTELANAEAARIEAENRKLELLKKNNELREAVGGISEAGQAPAKKETPDEKWAREAKIRYAGTGMDPT